MENGNAKFKQYLLGSLAAPEAAEIDRQIIEDASLEEKLDRAENELLEDYLDDALSAAEIRLFEKNFLVSPARKMHFKQILLLRKYAGDLESKSVCAEAALTESPKTFFVRLGEFFSPKMQLAAAALTVLIVVSAIGIFFYNANAPTVLEREFAAVNQTDLSDLSEYKNTATVNLVSGMYRSADGAGKLAANKLTDRALFRLALPIAANPADVFKVQIISDGKVAFTQDAIRFYNNPNGQELRFFLPAAILKKGDYQIKIEKKAAAENSAVLYNFAVQ